MIKSYPTHGLGRQHYGCRCQIKDHSNWRVVVRNGNYSAFNGYRFTPSDYSQVVCMVCGVLWRTKAAYVDGLEDAPDQWFNLVGSVEA